MSGGKRIGKEGLCDPVEYTIAVAMVNLINTGAQDFNDGLYFDPAGVSVQLIKSVCRRIFEVTHQDQHYDSMMTR